jgi:hypothetical protein
MMASAANASGLFSKPFIGGLVWRIYDRWIQRTQPHGQSASGADLTSPLENV